MCWDSIYGLGSGTGKAQHAHVRQDMGWLSGGREEAVETRQDLGLWRHEMGRIG